MLLAFAAPVCAYWVWILAGDTGSQRDWQLYFLGHCFLLLMLLMALVPLAAFDLGDWFADVWAWGCIGFAFAALVCAYWL
jgi:hypothetical protein